MITLQLADILTVVYASVGICLVIVLICVIRILMNIAKATKKISETIVILNEFILKPINKSKEIYQKVEQVVEKYKEHKREKAEEDEEE